MWQNLRRALLKHINVEEQKRKEDPIDFALWKRQKEPDEIAGIHLGEKAARVGILNVQLWQQNI